MKTSILIAFVLVTVTVTSVQSSSTNALPQHKLEFKDLRTHCTGECIRMYSEEFRSDSTDRTTQLITSCIDQCVNLIEKTIEKEQNKEGDSEDETIVIDTRGL
ncbi:hypothetical protein LSAT2_014004 [Lamellibrachia satsuma]|nr:hypothetical protein LSAT2_014004 [Lamellibrachia satsuma]